MRFYPHCAASQIWLLLPEMLQYIPALLTCRVKYTNRHHIRLFFKKLLCFTVCMKYGNKPGLMLLYVTLNQQSHTS